MPHYYYTLKKNNKRSRDQSICYAPSHSEVIPTVLGSLLLELRTTRLRRLREKYLDGQESYHTDFLDNCRKRLPEQYRQYCDSYSKLYKSMASMYEISKTYEVIDIMRAPDCTGCRYESMQQEPHMECPHGCLHTVEDCHFCTNNY